MTSCTSTYTNYGIAKTEFIFVSETAILGGIETLMVRLANTVFDQQSSVSVFCPGGPITRELRQGIKIAEAIQNVRLENALERYIPQEGTEHVSIWLSHPYMLRDAYRFQRMLWDKWGITSNCISGIFVPAHYFEGNSKFGFIGRMKEAIVHKLPPIGTIYFMSEAVRTSFVNMKSARYEKWPIKKLAASGNASKSLWKPRCTDVLTIVSVGRLDGSFKAYNFGASDIVRSLRTAGFNCVWNIWGDGKDLDAMRDYAKSSGVEAYVHFHGPLQYSQLSSEICKHDIFVGMGTAALEAAVCGVPTVVAIAGSQHYCAGYLYEAPSDSIGEDRDDLERKEIEAVIRQHTSLNKDARQAVGMKCKAAVTGRVENDIGNIMNDLADGFKYPANIQDRIRMGLYAAIVDSGRAVARFRRRPGAPKV